MSDFKLPQSYTDEDIHGKEGTIYIGVDHEFEEGFYTKVAMFVRKEDGIAFILATEKGCLEVDE